MTETPIKIGISSEKTKEFDRSEGRGRTDDGLDRRSTNALAHQAYAAPEVLASPPRRAWIRLSAAPRCLRQTSTRMPKENSACYAANVVRRVRQ